MPPNILRVHTEYVTVKSVVLSWVSGIATSTPVKRAGSCVNRSQVLPFHESFTLMSYYSATRGLLATGLIILNHGQGTRMTPELGPPLLTPTPHQREDVSALDRFSMHRPPTWRVFRGTRLELVTRCLRVRYLDHCNIDESTDI
ncbi:uncharacterized protein TNCV_4374581 [Trichonephila clavipes]|uniref:Uncharacterized protein n=1 Tax=Trichonephila clavipes TaxID=2585209 RepID=A0A8X6R8D5_TRICX|nr:uncharacterized protein TNCV_4374581 [Trichonephila clavipes]